MGTQWSGSLRWGPAHGTEPVFFRFCLRWAKVLLESCSAPSTHCPLKTGSPNLGSLSICLSSSLEGGRKSSFWDNLLALPDAHQAPLAKLSCSLLPSGSKAQGGGLLGRHGAVLEAASGSRYSLWHTGGPEDPFHNMASGSPLR